MSRRPGVSPPRSENQLLKWPHGLKARGSGRGGRGILPIEEPKPLRR